MRRTPRLVSAVVVAALCAAAIVASSSPQPAAAAPGPFATANGRGMMSVTDTGSAGGTSGPTHLFTVTVGGSGTFQTNEVGTATADGDGYNAIGYRASDQYIYGIISTASPATNLTLVRVNKDNSIDRLGQVPGLPSYDATYSATAGTFGAGATADTYYFMLAGGTENKVLRSLTFDAAGTPTPHSLALSRGITVYDWAYANGYLWGIQPNNGGKITQVDPNTGVVQDFATPDNAIPTALRAVGPTGAWALPNGNLVFVYSANARLIQLSVRSTPQFQPVNSATVTSSLHSDGTYIPSTNPVDLSIDKSAPVSVAGGASIQYTLKVTNNSAYKSSGSSIHDVLPAGVTNVSPPAGAILNGTDLFISLGSLAAGATRTVTYTATAPAGPTSLVNSVSVVGDEVDPVDGNNSAQVTTAVGSTQSVRMSSSWTIKDSTGTTIGTYDIPAQGSDTAPALPAGFDSSPTLTGQTSPTFGSEYTGFTVGQNVSVGQGPVTVPAGCTVTSQTVSAVNGVALATPASLPYSTVITASPTPNTFTVANSVTCDQTLTLVKKVAFGSLPATSWTLEAAAPAGALSGPNGKTGTPAVTGVAVTPQVSYALGESSAVPGSENYVPTSAGWTCASPQGPIQASGSSVTIGYGQQVTCTVMNTTATITVLKHIIDPASGLRADAFSLTVTPPAGLGTAATFPGSETANAANTFETKPGATYSLAEQASPSTAALSLGLQQSVDGGTTWTDVAGDDVAPVAGTSVMYRFVSQSVASVVLPLTGGLGLDVIAFWAIALFALIACLVLGQILRRNRARRLS